MRFLRRILGGERDAATDEASAAVGDERDDRAVDLDAEERQYELDVLRSESAGFDELTRRQLKYADRAWQPPPQGDGRRSE